MTILNLIKGKQYRKKGNQFEKGENIFAKGENIFGKGYFPVVLGILNVRG